jgi:hypothetical protein
MRDTYTWNRRLIGGLLQASFGCQSGMDTEDNYDRMTTPFGNFFCGGFASEISAGIVSVKVVVPMAIVLVSSDFTVTFP